MKVRVRAASVAWLASLSCLLVASLTPGVASAGHPVQRQASSAAQATATTIAPTAPPSSPTAVGTFSDLPTPIPSASMAATAQSTATPTPTPSLSPVPVAATLLAAPLSFQPNLGQADRAVSYLARVPGATLFLSGADATLVSLQSPSPDGPGASLLRLPTTPLTGTETVVRLHVVGAAATPQVSAEQILPGVDNYLTGSDPSAWLTNVPTYAQVRVQGVYPGIDLVYHGSGGSLEYDWQVAPGADPGTIQMAVQGAQGAQVDAQGNLLLPTTSGLLEQQAPVAYQIIDGQRHDVAASYAISGTNSLSFALGGYDPTQPLIIDPVLSYSTLLGGSGDDQGQSVAVDGTGSTYVTGYTASTAFITTTGSFSTTLAGSYDAFVTKLTPQGNGLVYSTYLGGSGADYGMAIAVNAAGNAYVAGYTASTDFPAMSGAIQRTYGGSSYDAFVTELNSGGSGLVYSTYLGGNGVDAAYGLALDASGDAYVTGLTSSISNTFPLANALQSSYGGGSYDAFAAKLNPSGSNLMYSTFLGGNGTDVGYGVAIDGAGNAYVTGATASLSGTFPLTNALQNSYGGGTYDGFVSKLNASGNALLYSTYLGGNGGDVGNAIAVDSSGSAYVTGATASISGTFPISTQLQATYAGGSYDAFVTKLTSQGSGLSYSTYLGGAGFDEGWGIALDSANIAYVVGATASLSDTFPLLDGVQGDYGGGTDDAFVAAVDAGGNALPYSTYLGGNGADVAYGIAVDGMSNAYVTGVTSSISNTFPLTNAVQSAPGGGNDAFVARLAATPDCPTGWSCEDIGGPALPGDQLLSGSLSGGTWTVQGSGTDIWGTSDQFHYVYQDIIGDSSMSTQIISQTNTGTCTKAGLMYRASTDPGAPEYMVDTTPDCLQGNRLISVQYRATQGGTSAAPVSIVAALSTYMRIARTGNTFTASTSSDGVTWTQISGSSVTLASMPTTARLGLVVDSYNAGAPSTATFGAISITGTADIVPLDTDTEYYTQAPNNTSNLLHLRLYNGPLGYTDPTGLQLRDTTLVTTSGVISPSVMPFSVQIAPDTGGSALASLTNEDGVTLSVGLAKPTPTPTVQAAVQVNAATYNGVVSAGSDLSLRSTVSGLDARVVIHNVSETGPFTLTLWPDPSTQAVPDPSGVILLTRVITDNYADDGSSFPLTQTEYTVQAPLLTDSSTTAAAAVLTGPVTMTLGAGTGGAQNVTLAVDPTWLHDANRVFPATLDVPIATGYSVADTGVFGTVNSCAPDVAAPQTRVVIGVASSCSYNGQGYFDLGALESTTPIVSATLRLYTPAQTNATGVLVYPNVPGATGSDPADQWPSWSSAPAVVTGSVGITQTASDGHWQSWDVSSLVQGWVESPETNNGFTLKSSGSPVVFASPLGAGGDAAAVAPYLDITFTAPAAQPSSFNDGARFIYGVAGTFKACGPSAIVCSGGGPTNTHAVASGQPSGFGGSFIRFAAPLTCTVGAATGAYWDDTLTTMSAAYNSSPRLIPMVEFDPSAPNAPGCSGALSSSDWSTELAAFVARLKAPPGGISIPSPLPATYFEVGNEPNFKPGYYGNDYPTIFEAAAPALYNNLSPGSNFPFYRILTGGIVSPTASDKKTDCPGNYNFISIAQDAITKAENAHVNPTDLGVAVHPYGFATRQGHGKEPDFFRNYYKLHTKDVGPCRDIDAMRKAWRKAFHSMPLVFTEVNWSTQRLPANTPHDQIDVQSPGAYLLDLFTYLFDKGYTQQPSSSPIRVAWFRGNDIKESIGGVNMLDPLGIYYDDGSEKTLHLTGSNGFGGLCKNTKVNNSASNLSNDYYYLRNGNCYGHH